MKRHITLFTIISIALIVLAGSCAAVLYSVPSTSFLWWVPILLLSVCVIAIVSVLIHIKQVYTDWLDRLANTLDSENRTSIQRFPLPTLLLSAEGEIVYANDLFVQQVLDGAPLIFGLPVIDLFAELSVETLSAKSSVDLTMESRKYTAYITSITKKNERHYAVYFVDNTDLKDIAEEYAASRPVVLQMSVDNFEEATEHLGSGFQAQVGGRIEAILEKMLFDGNGLCQKYGNERYVAVTEQRHLERLMDEGFPILNEIHEVCPESETPITVSIGVGLGETIEACRKSARKALSRASNRGGDQVAVPSDESQYTYFGGHSQSEKKRTKIRSREMANALRDMINCSDCVVVMGHRASDLDSVGSAVGLASTIRRIGRNAYVCVNRKNTMAGRLIEHLIHGGKEDLFIEPNRVKSLATDNSLLIVVDCHLTSRVDAPDLLDTFKRVVVIDHHPTKDAEKSEFIQNPVLLHQVVDASSTCELVTEILPYLCNEEIDRSDAEALLSGIILDSRYFVLNTGELTFEAAAYLRNRNADPITVKRLFAENIEFHQYKNVLISTAERYRDMVIASTENDYRDYRAAAAQAADELLCLPDVKASFVVANMGEEWNISARSYGDGCNVGIIMEQLKGGGHTTMAATQIREKMTLEQVKAALIQAINVGYYGEKLEISADDNENVGG